MRSQVTSESRYGFRGVRLEEASNPVLPRTRARVRMEQGADRGEASITRIDDSDDEPLATWRDEVSISEEMGLRCGCQERVGTCW